MLSFGNLRNAAVASAVALSLGLPGAALADITIGVTLSSTGSGAALGIPMRNSLALWPTEIAGEKLNVVVLDDAGDPAAATTNARRLVTEDKADVLVGSALTPASIAVMGVAFETETPHLAGSPVPLQPGRDKWTFVLPQRVSLMAEAIFEHMRKNNIKTVGYIGFSDSWGDLWLNELKSRGEPFGIKVVAEERYARADTSVSGQVLKLVAARPDAVLVGASGTGAALPQIALRERGFRGSLYQTHGAVTKDFIRIAGKHAENAIFASGPVMVPELQPEDAATKEPGMT
jgi:branched-chain amino acid transport system substrate-binding protein